MTGSETETLWLPRELETLAAVLALSLTEEGSRLRPGPMGTEQLRCKGQGHLNFNNVLERMHKVWASSHDEVGTPSHGRI